MMPGPEHDASSSPPEATSGQGAPRVEAVVFDLDGVIRHWNDDELDEVELAYGLVPREILGIAFSPRLGPAAVTGQLSYREWMDRIRREVIDRHGPDVAPALDVWEANVGMVDPKILPLLRLLRTQVRVFLLSNGTTRLRRDLHVLDLLDEFDEIFNTAEIGMAKPEPAVFRYVCDAIGTEPRSTAFVDDLSENIRGAEEVGLVAHRFEGLPGLRAFLEGLALRIR